MLNMEEHDAELAGLKRTAFTNATAIDQLLVRIDCWSDFLLEGSRAQRDFFDVYNKYGLAFLECADGKANFLDLQKLMGSKVPHEFADKDGIVWLDPSASRCSIGVKDSEAEHMIHTDESYADTPCDIITMQSHKAAPSGGDSFFVSGKAMWDAAREQLDAGTFDALYRPCVTAGRKLPGSAVNAEATFAVFTEAEGLVSVRWRSRDKYVKWIDPLAKKGIDFLESFVNNEDNRITIKLQPGQICVCDNSAALHGRTPFPAGEERRVARINYYLDGPLRSTLARGF